MNDHEKPSLLKDILDLYARHGTAAFRELACQLRDPQFVADASALLESLASALPECKRRTGIRRTTARPKQSLLDIAMDLSGGDADREQLLTRLVSSLQDRRTLKTLAELQRFSRDRGLTVPVASKRANAVRSLLQAVAALPHDRLSTIVDSLGRKREGTDSSLQGWSDIILRKREGSKS